MIVDRSEQARLQVLRQLDLLDTPPSESFDRITRMAGQLFNLPIAAVSLTDSDRQWFKSRLGVDHCQIPRELAPCGKVADTNGVLVIPDLQADACYRESLLARSGIRFYAGAPLTTRDGFCLGAMCVLGTEPREVRDGEKAALTDLAAMVMAQIELQHAFGRLDPISGLPNRNQFIEDLEDRGRDLPGKLQRVVLADLIGARDLADVTRVFGASVIDDIMRDIAQALIKALGPKTAIYQVGVTQFAWFVSSRLREATLTRDLTQLGEDLSHHLLAASVRTRLSPVFGVAPLCLGREIKDAPLRRAYNAAEQARQAGTDVGLYSPGADKQHLRRFRLLSDMRQALSTDGELALAYQPRIDLRTGDCVGAEALLRWQHPILGAISPGEFIPLVEQTDLALPLTAWVIEAAIRQLVSWQVIGMTLAVSVNVSAHDLDHPTFAQSLLDRLRTAGIPATAFEIEITESALIRNRDRVEAQLHQIRSAGVRVAIDDFGTGYSSLSYLRALPADIVKIDQSFIRDLAEDAKGRTLVQHLIALSRDLGFRVVAEGVEDRATYDLLRSWGCDEAQGYWMSRPLTPVATEMWLKATSTLNPLIELRADQTCA